ncbi:MAG: cyclic nucleotide-binding domain-containing protein, partial [Alphaproteobacteria bacterium]|nr:cyclic nucleotide-binding domain-containing protein [Alphaproteobacteria bacterium]HIJ43318.1 cyclic nucleotide-binding domain-containing protein [Rhodospirillaceae bacterium]
LRDNQLFHDLTEEEYNVVSGILKRKVYQPEETVFKEGGTDQILYIIKKGEVRICKQGPQGDLQTITLLKDRDIFTGRCPFSTERRTRRPSSPPA